MSGLLKKVTLETVGNGVAQELFAREIERIADNINDPNTNPIQKRKITLTFEFTPDPERREVAVLCGAKTVLAPVKPMKHTVFCGKVDGMPQMLGADPDQMELNLHTESEQVATIRRPYKED